MKRFSIGLISLLLGISGVVADEELSFKGKTVTMIVGSQPGGGTDASGRLIASLLAGHLVGKPNVIVRNIPGAEGIVSMNYFVQQVLPDGFTLTMGSTTQADPLLYRKPQSQFDPTTFSFVGGAGRGGTVLLISKDAEARLHDKSTAPVVMGALAGVPRSGMQMTAWGIEFLGWNAKWVLGYRGTNDLMVALERGEIDMTSTANLFQVQKFLDSGRFKILTQAGTYQKGQTIGRPEFGATPIFSTLLRDKIKAPVVEKAFEYWLSLTSLDKWIALPPKTPEVFIRAYRDAYQAAITDPGFAEVGKKISEGFEPISYDDVNFLVGKLGGTPPEAGSYISAMLRKQGIVTD